MKYAIVSSGGKQYKAVPGGTIMVDRLPNEIEEKIDLEEVLFVADGEQLHIGTPHVEGARIKATIKDQVKGPKIVVFKYKPKVRYRKKTGHRQRYTELSIEKIVLGQGEENGS